MENIHYEIYQIITAKALMSLYSTHPCVVVIGDRSLNFVIEQSQVVLNSVDLDLCFEFIPTLVN